MAGYFAGYDLVACPFEGSFPLAGLIMACSLSLIERGMIEDKIGVPDLAERGQQKILTMRYRYDHDEFSLP